MHKTAYHDAKKFAAQYLDPTRETRIVEIGAADLNGSLRPVFSREKWDYRGIDIAPGKGVDLVLSSETDWPEIKSGSFDVAISTQVLEHVRKPWRWLAEIVRIVRSGGLVYVCAPNTAHYHEHPVDCWRVWPQGMRALMEDAGLQVLEAYFHQKDTTGIGRKP